jgi:hypothetical protein
MFSVIVAKVFECFLFFNWRIESAFDLVNDGVLCFGLCSEDLSPDDLGLAVLSIDSTCLG